MSDIAFDHFRQKLQPERNGITGYTEDDPAERDPDDFDPTCKPSVEDEATYIGSLAPIA